MRTSHLILILALAFTGDAFAQAATPVLRFKAVVDNLRNADTPNAQLTRVSDILLPLAAPGQNTSGWTAAQKATAILAFLQADVKHLVNRAKLTTDLPVANATVTTAATAAAADMD